jgi:hypothetical protein
MNQASPIETALNITGEALNKYVAPHALRRVQLQVSPSSLAKDRRFQPTSLAFDMRNTSIRSSVHKVAADERFVGLKAAPLKAAPLKAAPPIYSHDWNMAGVAWRRRIHRIASG